MHVLAAFHSLRSTLFDGYTPKGRSLAGACLAHMLHDGYTDQLYALLPVWQSQFGLSYAGLAVLRALYYGSMSALQVPLDHWVRTWTTRSVLALSTIVAAIGFLVMALPLGLASLCVGLLLGGIGSSVQHPRASHLIADTYGTASRGPLGIYNFAGDVGKATIPATVALLLPVLAWRTVVGITGLCGIVVASILLMLIPRRSLVASSDERSRDVARGSSGFRVLLSIGVLDTATRMGYLLFLPFLIQGHGGSAATVGLGLALIFSGGALGKASCGWLAARIGVVGSVVLTEVATGALILATLVAPLVVTMMILPLLGMALNGTSSVLYGAVPELAPDGNTGRAFALFYTGTIGSSGLAPIAYGAIADRSSQTIGILSAAFTALAIVPLVLSLRSAFAATSD